MKGFPVPLLFSILLVSCFSCSNPVMDERKAMMPPDSVIPEAVMVELLADVHVLEAGLLNIRNHGKKITGLPDVYYQALFRKYRISQTRFQLNLTYYQWDPDVYSALYDKVIAELKKRKRWIPGTDSVKVAAED